MRRTYTEKNFGPAALRVIAQADAICSEYQADGYDLADARMRITDEFVCVDDCPICLGSGVVCEEHPDKAWDEGDGCCGMPGAPCPHVKCRWANAATIAHNADGTVVRWPCGLEVEAADSHGRLYVDELRRLHRTGLLSRMTP